MVHDGSLRLEVPLTSSSLLHKIVIHAILQPLFKLVAPLRPLSWKIEAPGTHLLILWTLPLLMLFHIKEFQHHIFHKVIEKLLIRTIATFRLLSASFVIVVFWIKPLRKRANPRTTNPLNTFLFLFSDLRIGSLSSDHQLLILFFVGFANGSTRFSGAVVVHYTLKLFHFFFGNDWWWEDFAGGIVGELVDHRLFKIPLAAGCLDMRVVKMR
jgi:hypothetical protein